MNQTLPQEVDLCHSCNLTPTPLKPRSGEPPLKWCGGWNPTPEQLVHMAAKPSVNWAVRCGRELAILDFDSPQAFNTFSGDRLEIAATKKLGCQVVRSCV